MTTGWTERGKGEHTTKRASDRRHDEDDILRTGCGRRGMRFGSLAANMTGDEDDGGDGGGGDVPGAVSSSDVARRVGHVICPTL